MKKKLNFRFHDPNPTGVAAEYILKELIEANLPKAFYVGGVYSTCAVNLFNYNHRPSPRNKTRSAPIYITKKHLGVSALSTIPKDSERPVILGEYIIEHKATVRQAASEFGISKSTVHKDVSERLKKVRPSLYKEVRVILDINKQERHIRGGEATKQKYRELSGIK